MLISALFLFTNYYIKGVDSTSKWFSEARLYLRWLLFTPTIKTALVSQEVCSCEVSITKKGLYCRRIQWSEEPGWGAVQAHRVPCHMFCLCNPGPEIQSDMLQFCIPRHSGWRGKPQLSQPEFFKHGLTFSHSPVLLLIWRSTQGSKGEEGVNLPVWIRENTCLFSQVKSY